MLKSDMLDSRWGEEKESRGLNLNSVISNLAVYCSNKIIYN